MRTDMWVVTDSEGTEITRCATRRMAEDAGNEYGGVHTIEAHADAFNDELKKRDNGLYDGDGYAIDWRGAEPAEGAPIYIEDGYYADDGNNAVRYRYADSGEEAAKDYVDSGSWMEEGDPWVDIQTWRECVSVDHDGRVIVGIMDEDTHRVAIEPPAPRLSDVVDDLRANGFKVDPNYIYNSAELTDLGASDADSRDEILKEIQEIIGNHYTAEWCDDDIHVGLK